MEIPLTKKKPAISVIITAYNRDQYLEQCVNSVLNQTIAKDLYEIIIIKNFESPVDRMADTENVIILHSDVRELGPKLYTALNRSKGDIIAFMDDDDRWKTEKLETVLNIFQRNKRLGYYHNAYTFIDEKGDSCESKFRLYDTIFRASGQTWLWKPGDSVKKLHAMRKTGAFFNMSSISVRREVLEQTESKLPLMGFSPDFFISFSALCSDLEIMEDSNPLTLYRLSHKVSDFKDIGHDSKIKSQDWQYMDRLLLLRMTEEFRDKVARSIANFELLDFLSIRFIRQNIRSHDTNRKNVINFLKENRLLIITMPKQLRYLWRNMGMLICIVISPKFARKLMKNRDKSFKRDL